MELEVQTRTEDGALNFFSSLSEAMESASKDPTVWKISFSLVNGERIRLTKIMHFGEKKCSWVYDPIVTDEQILQANA